MCNCVAKRVLVLVFVYDSVGQDESLEKSSFSRPAFIQKALNYNGRL